MARVLIVDDEVIFLNVIPRLFRSQGWDLITSNKPLEAAERLRGETFDLLITDYRMPNMTGLELIEVGIKANPQLRVIIITGNEHDLQGHEIPEQTTVISKPFNNGDLLATAKLHLGTL